MNDSNAPYDNIDSNDRFISEKIFTDLKNHIIILNQKVGIVNNGYDLGRKKIENECQKITNQIKDAAQHLINEIILKRDMMLNDIEAYKNEALLDYEERYENNPRFEKNKQIINAGYNIILQNFSQLEQKNSDVNENCKILIEKIELLNTKINDTNARLMPDPNPSIGIIFNKNEGNIQIPLIGDISYESVYKVDMVTKISYLNNYAQQRIIDLNHLIEKHLIAKHFVLISKNKALLIYEKVFGKVNSIFVKVIYYNGMVLYEMELLNVGNISKFCVYNDLILLDFKKGKNDHILYLYNINLKCLGDQPVNFEIESMQMNDNCIFLMSEKKPFINEYDYKLNYKTSYGQKTKEKGAFFVKDEIIGITENKIFVKYEDELRLLDRLNGEILSKVHFADIKISKIFLDYNKEKYLVFNGYEKLSYYNHKGELLIENKLRINEKFQEFQYTRSGHFAFIHNNKNFILAI